MNYSAIGNIPQYDGVPDNLRPHRFVLCGPVSKDAKVAEEAFNKKLADHVHGTKKALYWETPPIMLPLDLGEDSPSYQVSCQFALGPAPVKAPFPGDFGYRGHKGPNPDNTSGFRATGHRVLLRPDPVETTSAGGIVLTAKIVHQNKTKCAFATVLEVGHDAWTDKSTDFCQVGDRVMVGEHTGVFQTSPIDGLEYRFINDLDIITPIIEPIK